MYDSPKQHKKRSSDGKGLVGALHNIAVEISMRSAGGPANYAGLNSIGRPARAEVEVVGARRRSESGSPRRAIRARSCHRRQLSPRSRFRGTRADTADLLEIPQTGVLPETGGADFRPDPSLDQSLRSHCPNNTRSEVRAVSGRPPIDVQQKPPKTDPPKAPNRGLSLGCASLVCGRSATPQATQRHAPPNAEAENG